VRDIPKWHNKPCPRCGKGVIINDAEKEGAILLLRLIDDGLVDESTGEPYPV
jgi:hypothetical protein